MIEVFIKIKVIGKLFYLSVKFILIDNCASCSWIPALPPWLDCAVG